MPQQFASVSYDPLRSAGRAFAQIPIAVGQGIDAYRASTALNTKNTEAFNELTNFFDRAGISYDKTTLAPKPGEADYEVRAQKTIAPIIGQLKEKGVDVNTLVKTLNTPGVAWPQIESLLKVNKAEGIQKGITAAVTDAASTEMPRGFDKLMSASPQQGAQMLEQNPEAFKGMAVPQTKEELYGAVAGRLPEGAMYSDLTANPTFQLTAGRYASQDDEMAKARLKLQQDAEARKKAQGDEANRLKGISARQKENDNALQYYKLGLRYQEGDINIAEKLNTSAEETKKDRGFVESQIDKWNQIKKGATEFGVYSPEEIAANIAMYERQYNTLDDQIKALEKRSSEIRNQAYGKGSEISKGSKKVFRGGAATPTPVAPAAPVRQTQPLNPDAIGAKYGL